MLRSNEQDIPPGRLYETVEAGQRLIAVPQICFNESGQDELNRRLTHHLQSDRINYEMSCCVTQEQDYCNREVRGQWNYENNFYHLRHDHEYSEQAHFPVSDLATVGQRMFEIPNGFDYAQDLGQDRLYRYEAYLGPPMQLQISDYYSDDPSSVRPRYTEQSFTNNSDYESHTENNIRPIFNPEGGENLYTCTDDCASAMDLSLNSEYRANQTGAANNTASNVDIPGWRLSAEDWNSLDIPLDMSLYRQMLDQINSSSATPDSETVTEQTQRLTSFRDLPEFNQTAKNTDLDVDTDAADWELLDLPLDMSMNTQATCQNLPEPSGTVIPAKASQQKSKGRKKDVHPKPGRRRGRVSDYREDITDAKPKTESERLQKIRESVLLASYRPILPKPSDSVEPILKIPDDDEMDELRRKRRGWKCCAETFNDYNVYQNHIRSAHVSTNVASKSSRTKSSNPTPKKAPTKPSSDSKRVVCPFCSTKHEILGPDVATKPHWNETDCLQCPLCDGLFKTLRQLKIHFCLHFWVKVNDSEKCLCRYCSKYFVLLENLRKHESICMVGQAAKQNSEAEKQLTAEVGESTSETSVASAAIGVSEADAALSPIATPARSTARTSMVASSTLAASSTASAEIAAESPAAEAAFSAAETPPTSAATSSKSEDDRLFYCPECGKLFTWAGSVRRHQQTSHVYIEGKSKSASRQKNVRRPRQQPENESQRQPPQLHSHRPQQRSTEYAPASTLIMHDENDFGDLQIDEQTIRLSD